MVLKTYLKSPEIRTFPLNIFWMFYILLLAENVCSDMNSGATADVFYSGHVRQAVLDSCLPNFQGPTPHAVLQQFPAPAALICLLQAPF